MSKSVIKKKILISFYINKQPKVTLLSFLVIFSVCAPVWCERLEADRLTS